jgi:hypothetical protein
LVFKNYNILEKIEMVGKSYPEELEKRQVCNILNKS